MKDLGGRAWGHFRDFVSILLLFFFFIMVLHIFKFIKSSFSKLSFIQNQKHIKSNIFASEQVSLRLQNKIQLHEFIFSSMAAKYYLIAVYKGVLLAQ